MTILDVTLSALDAVARPDASACAAALRAGDRTVDFSCRVTVQLGQNADDEEFWSEARFLELHWRRGTLRLEAYTNMATVMGSHRREDVSAVSWGSTDLSTSSAAADRFLAEWLDTVGKDVPRLSFSCTNNDPGGTR